MAKEEASFVSVKGSVGSAGHSTGACVKAFLRLVKAVSCKWSILLQEVCESKCHGGEMGYELSIEVCEAKE